jgi:hypothetical protein
MSVYAEHHVHKFLGFGMVYGLAVCSYMFFICFGGLANTLETREENERVNGDEPHRPQRQQ